MDKVQLSQEVIRLHADMCSALADPSRLLLLYALADKPHTVSELTADVNISQPTTSRHLRVLRERALVTVDRRGPSSYYALADHRMIEAVDLLRGVLATQLDAEGRIERQARAARPAGTTRMARAATPRRSASAARKGTA